MLNNNCKTFFQGKRHLTNGFYSTLLELILTLICFYVVLNFKLILKILSLYDTRKKKLCIHYFLRHVLNNKLQANQDLLTKLLENH